MKRKAWFFGYDNAVDVLSKSDGLSPDDPVYDDIRNPSRSTIGLVHRIHRVAPIRLLPPYRLN